MKRLEPAALLMMFLGGLNWAILGLSDGDTNVLRDIFGSGTLLNVVYVIIGVASLVLVPRLLDSLHIHIGRPRPRGA
ncbi:MAG TPA: DUF378 domain-containing protein [Solirubrobacterales bacterium]|nr:DUF378 domain-containing protein [Solirubrobacterales bacterium]